MSKPKPLASLPNIKQATKAYEAWLRDRIPLINSDLRLKHRRMKESPFHFLRPTFYRWVQLWPRVCPALSRAVEVLGVGDLHVDNFGTWRDCEGRLIWGVNDFDEAAQVPYTNDLVRLAASALLAIRESHLSSDPKDACDQILAGYRDALQQGGAPLVLAEHHRWLGALAATELRDASAYWQKFDALPTVRAGIPAAVTTGLIASLPEPRLRFRVVHRRAGLGSLGRRRFMALAGWRGGMIAREAKELVNSAWCWEQKDCARNEISYEKIMKHAVRVPDPFVAVRRHWVLRRLAPDCTRIELGSLPRMRDELKLFHAMGGETGNIHLGTKGAAGRLLKDLRKRSAKWFYEAAEAMAKATLKDWREWRAG
jgi:hypothetical protein